jgi:hypothetical protein
MSKRISQLSAAASLTGTELVEVSKLSATVTISGTTISAQASDNSFNDSAAGFVAAGFATGKAVKVSGFTGSGANNIASGIVTAVAAGKLTIGGTDGDMIVDDAAGESVTITQWDSRRSTAQAVADLAGAGGAALGWFNVLSYGAAGDGSTDDTAAIQAAINAAGTTGGGVVYFPRGVYIVGGALQDTSRANAQLLLPSVNYIATEQISIELRGEQAPPPVFSVIAATPLPDNQSVIKGTLNAGIGGSCLGGWGPSGSYDNFTNIYLTMRNLTVRMPSNPVLTAIDLSHVAAVDLDNIIADVGSYYVAGFAQPTTSNSYGIQLPANNNGATTRLGTVHVGGYYAGYKFGEHSNGQSVNAWGCWRAFEFAAANYHASVFTRLMSVHCAYGIVGTGAYHALYIDQFNIEHAASGWMAPIYDMDDAGNYLTGRINWHTVLAGTGINWTFLRNGADYVEARRTSGGANALTYAGTMSVNLDVFQEVDITLAGNGTINFSGGAHGQKIICRLKQDGTGGRVPVWGSMVRFGSDIPAITLTATAGKTDVVGLIRHAVDGKYDVVAVAKGY